MKTKSDLPMKNVTMAVERLPLDIKSALDERLRTSGFTQYVAHSQWLAAQGYTVSKSAINRYGLKHQEQIRAQARLNTNAEMNRQTIRLRCLEVAAKTASGQDMLPLAEELLNWVYAES